MGFKHLEFKMLTPVSVKNNIFNGEVFQIKVSDGQVYPLGINKF